MLDASDETNNELAGVGPEATATGVCAPQQNTHQNHDVEDHNVEEETECDSKSNNEDNDEDNK